MSKYEIVREEIFPGTIEDFRALMYEVFQLQPEFKSDQLFLQGERTPSDYPQGMARWEITRGSSFEQRGYILARQLPDRTTNIRFAYHRKFKPIGPQFDMEYANNILRSANHGEAANFGSYEIPTVIILAALPVESKAICAHLTHLREEIHPQGTVYERGSFSSVSQTWEVGIAEIGMGNPTAGIEAERAIQYFKPNVILFVGIAGGIKDVKIGDVVAATKVYGYEFGKDELTFRPRPDVMHSTYRMEQRARAEAKKENWLQRIIETQPRRQPSALVGPIAAGERVVTSTKSVTFEFLQTHYGDTLAVEMEGYGFLRAVHANLGVEALVIRGISDLLDNKKDADVSGSQEIAAQNASAFTFEILANLVIQDKDPA